MTFEQIYKEFCNQFPDIIVIDYRPSILPYTIHIWTKFNSCLLYHYQPSFGTGFIIGKSQLYV